MYIRYSTNDSMALPRIYFIMQLYFMLKGFYYMLYLGLLNIIVCLNSINLEMHSFPNQPLYKFMWALISQPYEKYSTDIYISHNIHLKTKSYKSVNRNISSEFKITSRKDTP